MASLTFAPISVNAHKYSFSLSLPDFFQLLECYLEPVLVAGGNLEVSLHRIILVREDGDIPHFWVWISLQIPHERRAHLQSQGRMVRRVVFQNSTKIQRKPRCTLI